MMCTLVHAIGVILCTSDVKKKCEKIFNGFISSLLFMKWLFAGGMGDLQDFPQSRGEEKSTFSRTKLSSGSCFITHKWFLASIARNPNYNFIRMSISELNAGSPKSFFDQSTRK